MPFITIQTGATISPESKKRLAEALGGIIAVIPGKNADNLMLAIHDGAFMAFGKNDGKKCLHMHVVLYKQAALAEKALFVEKSTSLFSAECGVDPGCVYVTFQELDNWGVGGRFK